MPLKEIDSVVEAGGGSYNKGKDALDPSYVSGGIQDAENFANKGPSANQTGQSQAQSPETTADVGNKESEGDVPASNWKTNATGAANQPASQGGLAGWAKNSFQKIKNLKGGQKAAAGGLVTLIFGAGLGFSALFSPSMLLVHMTEIAKGKLDTSSISLNARNNKLLAGKIESSTKGHCGAVITAACRFSTLSDKNVAKLKDAGIEVVGEKKSFAGINRTKPTTYKYTNSSGATTELSAKEFSSFAKTNPEFRAALKKAYNPRFAQYTSSAWKWVSSKLGLSKAKTKPLDGTDSENRETVNDEARQAVKPDADTTPDLDEPQEDGSPCDQACIDDRTAKLNEQKAILDETKSTAGKELGPVLEEADPAKMATKMAGSTLASAAKLTGNIDNACTALNMVRTVGFAAKTIRALQLASYAMIFLRVADEIKAGTADASTVAYLGGVLTAVTVDVKDTNKRISGSATDSFGYKYLAYGDTTSSGASASLASRYLVGGGLTGELITFTDSILKMIPGGRQTCRVLGNPWVQAGSLIGGIAMLLVPGVGVSVKAATVGKGILQAGIIAVGMAILPGMLGDIVAGTTTDDIQGESSGMAWFMGSSVIMGGWMSKYVNAPMTVDQAVAYSSYQQQTVAMQAAEDRATLSPFDTSSQYTFLGSIVNSFLPIYTSASSIPAKLMATLSTPLTAFANQANAESNEQTADSYEQCTDVDYRDLNLATDPFCNVLYGIPQKYLDSIDPAANADSLQTKGLIDASGVPQGEFKTFIDNCMKRTDPLGYGGPSDDASKTGKDCIVNDSNAPYYIYWMDSQAEAGMSDEDPIADDTSSSSSSSTSSPTSGSSLGPIATGGLTSAQATSFLNNEFAPERDAGTYGTSTSPGLKYQCVTFIKWYLTKYISDAYRGQPAGNGKDVVQNLANGTYGAKIKFPTGQVPKLYAIASFAAGTPGWAVTPGGGGTYGHTALVVGMTDSTVIFANAGDGSTYVREVPIASVSNNPKINYAYTDGLRQKEIGAQ